MGLSAQIYNKEVRMRHDRLCAVIRTGGACGMILLLVLAGCTFRTPAQPVWNARFTVPLFDEQYTMRDLADDSEYISAGSSGMEFSFSQDIETQGIGQNLKLSGTSYTLPVVPVGGGPVNVQIEFPLDSLLVTHALIKSGRMQVYVTNPNVWDAGLSMEVAQLVNTADQNNPLNIDTNISAGVSNTMIIDADLGRFSFDPDTMNWKHRLGLSAQLSSVSGSGTYTPLTITVQFTELVFSQISGKIKRVRVALDPNETEIDMPEELEGFEAGEVDLSLNLEAFPFRVIADITVESLESITGDLFSITITDTIPASETGAPYRVTVPAGEVTDFINSLPTRIQVGGLLEINDRESEATVYDTTAVRGEAVFRIPMTVKYPQISNSSRISEIEMDEDARDTVSEIRKRLISATLAVDVYNHIPIGIDTVRICFAADSSSVFSNPDLARTLNIGKAVTQGDPQAAVDSVKTENSITLSRDDLQFFEENSLVYYGIHFVLPGTGGTFISIQPDDYIRLISWIEADIQTDFSDDEGGE